MNVALFVTCLADQLWPEVGVATVRVLRRAGCDVSFDQAQTCCAQPAYNTGYRDEARAVARGFIAAYDKPEVDAVVLPSGSCGAMVHHYEDLFADEPEWLPRARRVAHKTHELSRFLVRQVGALDLGARLDAKIAWHDACHGLRDLGIKSEPRKLLERVQGVTCVDLDPSEGCCGFGGTFSVKHPELSIAILDRKLERLAGLGVDLVSSCDVSCLMQIGGRLEHLGSPVKPMHLAEILAAGMSA